MKEKLVLDPDGGAGTAEAFIIYDES